MLGDAVKRFEHQVGGAAVVAEHLVRVDAGLGSGAGANLPAGDVAGGQLLVACGIGLARGAVGLDAVAHAVVVHGGDRAGDVRAVVTALAVDRVGVRGGIVVAGVRVIRGAGVIVTALELRLVEQLADLRVGQRVGGGVQRGLVGLGGACAAEIGVRVVEAGVDDCDVHALAGLAGLFPSLDGVDQLVVVLVRGGFATAVGRVERLLGRQDRDVRHRAGLLGELAQRRRVGANGYAGQRIRGGVDLLGAGVQRLQLREHVHRGLLGGLPGPTARAASAWAARNAAC